MEEKKPTSNSQQNDQGIDKEYKQIVEEAIKKEQNFDIPNTTLNHAVFLSQKLLSCAERDVKILTGELSSNYYSRVRDELEKTADRFHVSKMQGAIKVIIWEEGSEQNTDFKTLQSKYKDVIEVKNARQTFSTGINHFLVSDSKRYRIEDSHTRDDVINENVKGRANFNNPDEAKLYNNAFDNIWSAIR